MKRFEINNNDLVNPSYTLIKKLCYAAEISMADKSIFLHEPKGRAADAYRNLVEEVMQIGETKRIKSADLSR